MNPEDMNQDQKILLSMGKIMEAHVLIEAILEEYSAFVSKINGEKPEDVKKRIKKIAKDKTPLKQK